jgi:hypothetical protein
VSGIGGSREASWSLYRRGNALIDPDSNTTLGYEAIYLGTAKVLQAGEPATIELASVTQEIGVGIAWCPPAGRRSFATPHTLRRPRVEGRVMSIYGGLNTVGEAGKFSIIALNRGRADGLELGHVLALYRNRGTVIDRRCPKARQMQWSSCRRALRPDVRVPRVRPRLVCAGHVRVAAGHSAGRRPHALTASPGDTPTSPQGLAGWLQLSLTPGLGAATLRELLRRFGLPEAVVAAGRRALSNTLTPDILDRLYSRRSRRL